MLQILHQPASLPAVSFMTAHAKGGAYTGLTWLKLAFFTNKKHLASTGIACLAIAITAIGLVLVC